MNWLNQCHFGDCLETLQRMPDGIAQTCVTSPPYFGLRDYGHDGQIGLEPTPDEFIAKLVSVFREVRRVLRVDGTLWLNIGDSYSTGTSAARQQSTNPGVGANRPEAQNSVGRIGNPPGCKTKDLIGIPWMLAFALRADNWYLRQDIIWHKPNPMPESVTDRCTKAHEYIFLLSKSQSYRCDMAAIAEQGVATENRGGNQNMKVAAGIVLGRKENPNCGLGENWEPSGTRNKRSVWTVSTKPYKGAHFATFPTELIEPCIIAGAPVGGVVLDPFFGSGTTGQVAQDLGRKFIGCEINQDYKALQDERLSQPSLELEAA